MSLGPVRTKRGTECLARILRCADLVIVRDGESAGLLTRLGEYGDKLRFGADCALNVVPSAGARLEEILRRVPALAGERPLIGFNINSYLDAFVRPGREGIARREFVSIVAAVIDRAVEEFGADALMVITQVMDLGIASELVARVRHRERLTLVSNEQFSHADIAAVLSKLAIFVGMRTHSLILSTAVGTPVAGIVAYPKNRGYLRSIGMGDQLIEFDDFSEENLWRLVERTWRERGALRERLLPAIAREKERARGSAELLRPYLA